MKLLAFSTVAAGLLCLWSVAGVLRGPGLLRRFNRLIAAAVWGAACGLLGAVWLLLHLFNAFAGETLVATVTARWLAPEEFELTYQPSEAPDAAPARVRLRGDQWAVSGGIIKWHRWLTGFGVQSYHKPLRLTGQFADARAQRAHPPAVYELDPRGDRVWEAFYWAGQRLPFVEAVYGSAAYVYVEPGTVQQIYVTPSGYLIKRRGGR